MQPGLRALSGMMISGPRPVHEGECTKADRTSRDYSHVMLTHARIVLR